MSWQVVLGIVAAVCLPVVWGAAVHRLFDIVEERFKKGSRPNDNTYSDYQI